MAIIQNYCCENCSKILLGQKGIARISENYISITGQVTLQKRDPENPKYRYFIYCSPSKDAQMHFCDAYCLEEYCAMKEDRYHNHRVASLRKETDFRGDAVEESGGGFDSRRAFGK